MHDETPPVDSAHGDATPPPWSTHETTTPPPPPPPMTAPTPTRPPTTSSAVPTPAAPPPPFRLGTGVLFGLGAALVGGAVWYAIVALTKRQYVMLAVLLGLFVGVAVVAGARRANVTTALVAAVITAIAVVVSYFYVDRYFIIKAIEADGKKPKIDLIPSVDMFVQVVKAGYREETSQWLYTIVAIGVAALAGGGLSNRTAAARRPAR